MKSSFLKTLIHEVIAEANDIKAVKGKAIKSINGSENKIEIVLDDNSTLVINTNGPDAKLEYRLERGMIKSNGSNLSSHGNKPTHCNAQGG